jgi:hypothetical protein
MSKIISFMVSRSEIDFENQYACTTTTLWICWTFRKTIVGYWEWENGIRWIQIPETNWFRKFSQISCRIIKFISERAILAAKNNDLNAINFTITINKAQGQSLQVCGLIWKIHASHMDNCMWLAYALDNFPIYSCTHQKEKQKILYF